MRRTLIGHTGRVAPSVLVQRAVTKSRWVRVRGRLVAPLTNPWSAPHPSTRFRSVQVTAKDPFCPGMHPDVSGGRVCRFRWAVRCTITVCDPVRVDGAPHRPDRDAHQPWCAPAGAGCASRAWPTPTASSWRRTSATSSWSSVSTCRAKSMTARAMRSAASGPACAQERRAEDAPECFQGEGALTRLARDQAGQRGDRDDDSLGVRGRAARVSGVRGRRNCRHLRRCRPGRPGGR